MLRHSFVDKYNDELVEAFKELLNTCRLKICYPDDLRMT